MPTPSIDENQIGEARSSSRFSFVFLKRCVIWLLMLATIAGGILLSFHIIQKLAIISGHSWPLSATSLQECIATNDEVLKTQCGFYYADKLKDASICLQVYGNTDKGYYCKEAYDELHGYTPPNISMCQGMVTTLENGAFYKDDCFRGIALSSFNADPCKYLSTFANQANCTQEVQIMSYRKKNLCGPLFVGNKVAGASSCLDYVKSLHDVKKCNLLTRAEGPLPEIRDECIKGAQNAKRPVNHLHVHTVF